MSISNNKLEFGDYQTPYHFCKKVTHILSKTINPDVIFEPTFGVGNFLKASEKTFINAQRYIGNELNRKYYLTFKQSHMDHKYELYNENIFNFDHAKIVNSLNNDKLLIIGNPPWVTNSQLMSESMQNLPPKTNFKDLKGLDSITGLSNFDICEYIIIDLLTNYKNTNTTIAMLCKTNVVTNIIKYISKYDFKLKDIYMYKFDAKKIFNVACDACLFVATLDSIGEKIVSVFNIEDPDIELYNFGWKHNKFYSKFENLQFDIDGKFMLEWRQGIKHDCSKVVELTNINKNIYSNKYNEQVYLEDKYVYPILKSSDLKNNIIKCSSKYVIVPQSNIKQDTYHIKDDAPKTWNYLLSHKKDFDARKSSIYKNCPPFSIFGIGDYSFCKYKVAISGFYKEPNFVFIDSKEKAIMLDDTCYFVGFDDKKSAYITMVLLNSEKVRRFLYSIAFLDKKRPYTKDILMRIDISKIISIIDYTNFKQLAKNYDCNINITKLDYINYINKYTNSEK